MLVCVVLFIMCVLGKRYLFVRFRPCHEIDHTLVLAPYFIKCICSFVACVASVPVRAKLNRIA